MPLTSAQTRALAAMKAENGGTVSYHYKGHVMKRDGRIVPLTDPSERHRSGDPEAFHIEQDDDPEDQVDVIVVEPAVQEVKVGGKVTVAAKPAVTREERTKLPNDSDFQVEPTKDPNAPKDA